MATERKITKKTGTKSGNCRKTAKNAVKVAKKPVLTEKMDAPAGVVAGVEQVKKRKGNVANLKPYKKGEERARKNGKLGADVKHNNERVLNETATVVAESGKVPKLVKKALDIAEADPATAMMLLNVAEKAARIPGATYDQSDYAKQKLELSGKVDSAIDVHRFIIEDAVPKAQG